MVMNSERKIQATGRCAIVSRAAAGTAVWLMALVPLFAPPAAHAQKGMGDRDGVVRQGLQPATVTLSGTVVSVDTHPCEKTTGRSPEGTHLILDGGQGVEYNVHLGPADAVAAIAERLQTGSRVEVIAFRTAKMPENHYVAVRLVIEGSETVYRLRDENLRPLWSTRSSFESGQDRTPGYGERGRGMQLRRRAGRGSVRLR
jgi:hypothetical protein